MRRLIGAFALAVAPFLAAVPALANGSGRAGPGLGARYARVTDRATDEVTHMDGVMLRTRGEFLGLEGAVGYHNEDLRRGGDRKTWPVTASLLVYPIPTIYGLGGVGWYNTTIDFPRDSGIRDQTDSEFGYHLGFGAEVPVDRNLRLTGDARWQYVDYEFEEIPESVGEAKADAFSLNLGFLLMFH